MNPMSKNQLSDFTSSNLNLPFFTLFRYYGFWYKHDVSDVGDIRYYTYRNNMILEMSMAGEISNSEYKKIPASI